jgi:excisionase family DNA binding protein
MRLKKEKPPTPSLRELLSRGDLISPEELAPALRVARVTVYAWCRKESIPYLKIENCIRFDPAEVKKWLESKRIAQAQGPGPGSDNRPLYSQ